VGHLLWCSGEKAAGAAQIQHGEKLMGEDLIPFAGANLSALAACCSLTETDMYAHLDIGAARLTQRAVSHCHLFYYGMGMQACLQFEAFDRAIALASGLADYTKREPLPWADYLIRRTRLLAGKVSNPEAEARALRAIADSAPFALTI
jgi:hypothetical protein